VDPIEATFFGVASTNTAGALGVVPKMTVAGASGTIPTDTVAGA
jgi:hypothetical protein